MKTTKILNWDRDNTESGLKQLAQKCMEQQRRKTPSVPNHAIPKKVFRDVKANDLTQSIIAFFGVIGGICERVANMGRQITTGNRTKWVYSTGTNGTADVAAVWKGLSIKVEIKVDRDRQSEVQKAYQERIRQAGGIYIIARSFDGFLHEFFRAVEGVGDGGTR